MASCVSTSMRQPEALPQQRDSHMATMSAYALVIPPRPRVYSGPRKSPLNAGPVDAPDGRLYFHSRYGASLCRDASCSILAQGQARVVGGPSGRMSGEWLSPRPMRRESRHTFSHAVRTAYKTCAAGGLPSRTRETPMWNLRAKSTKCSTILAERGDGSIDEAYLDRRVPRASRDPLAGGA